MFLLLRVSVYDHHQELVLSLAMWLCGSMLPQKVHLLVSELYRYRNARCND
jgi:hypothetical protein